jgi:hypothetical protein
MRPGLVLPIRVVPLDDFYVLFNGPIPHNNVPSIGQFEENLFKTYGKHGVQKGRALNAEQRANIETFQTIQVLAQRYPELIPADLRKPSSESPTAVPRSRPRPPVNVMSVGRNAPCPCGSGKKFKQCCLRRRN